MVSPMVCYDDGAPITLAANGEGFVMVGTMMEIVAHLSRVVRVARVL